MPLKKKYNKLVEQLNLNENLQLIVQSNELGKIKEQIESLKDSLLSNLKEQTIQKIIKKEKEEEKKMLEKFTNPLVSYEEDDSSSEETDSNSDDYSY